MATDEHQGNPPDDPAAVDAESETVTEKSTDEPDSEFCDCRTAPLLENYSKCLMNRPHCKYCVPFGYAFFCRNPDHRSFNK